MKKIFRFILPIFSLIFIAVFTFAGVNVYADDAEKIYVGGMPAGLFLETRGAYVAGLCDVITDRGLKSPAKDAGIEVGDVILTINEREVNNAADIEKIVADDSVIKIVVRRKDKKEEFNLSPAKDVNQKYKIGIFVREGVSGIGTITYIKNDEFAALGHPVLDDDGILLKIKSGKIYDCNITGFIKGERGKPGELRGVFIKKDEVGFINKNDETGIYGKISSNFDKTRLTSVELGEGQPGNAHILTTIDGSVPDKYEISIVKADDEAGSIKNYVIKVTDERLLKTTGGIVQGMSGSPILQNGKLVGAVTHVFVNDPTRGFGISIGNMLKVK